MMLLPLLLLPLLLLPLLLLPLLLMPRLLPLRPLMLLMPWLWWPGLSLLRSLPLGLTFARGRHHSDAIYLAPGGIDFWAAIPHLWPHAGV